MGLKPGDTVLDPMMGSGTVLIEATLMGMDSVGVDVSPFCQFMTQAKLDGLTLSLEPVALAVEQTARVFEYFSKIIPLPSTTGRARKQAAITDLFEEVSPDGRLNERVTVRAPVPLGDARVRNFLTLAYLDAAGYSLRSSRKAPLEQFRAILERYHFVARKIQDVLRGTEHELGSPRSVTGDARALPLPEASVDGVIFSPPYSFAIDYLSNDAFHLDAMRVNIDQLRGQMVGLRGKSLRDQYHLYVDDMRKVLAECARILRPGRLCTIVVGTNNNQIARILDLSPDRVQGIHELLADLAEENGLKLVRRLERQITGMANTMRTEYILFAARL
jgi:DNA modification methylase